MDEKNNFTNLATRFSQILFTGSNDFCYNEKFKQDVIVPWTHAIQDRFIELLFIFKVVQRSVIYYFGTLKSPIKSLPTRPM